MSQPSDAFARTSQRFCPHLSTPLPAPLNGFAPVQVQANSKTLLLGAENKLYKPDKSMWVYATRAYFDHFWNDDIIKAREIVMDFGDDEQVTTYIDNITVEDNHETNVEGIFNLNGQRLTAPQKGINIINGKKIVIK